VVAQVTKAGLIEAKEARLMRDLRDFANQWDLNLKHQGFVEVRCENLIRFASLIAPASKLFASDSDLHACAQLTWMKRGRGGSPD
jgi:hypothetical protein